MKGYPFEVLFKLKDIEGAILSDQIKSLDFIARQAQFIQKIDSNTLQEVKQKVGLLLGL